MLPRNFPQMAQVDVHMPHNFHTELLAFLLIVYWRSTHNTIEFWHEVAPLSSLEHSEATVIKGLYLLHGWFILELNYEIGAALLEPL